MGWGGLIKGVVSILVFVVLFIMRRGRWVYMTCWLKSNMAIQPGSQGGRPLTSPSLWGRLTERERFKHFNKTKLWKHMQPEEWELDRVPSWVVGYFWESCDALGLTRSCLSTVFSNNLGGWSPSRQHELIYGKDYLLVVFVSWHFR